MEYLSGFGNTHATEAVAGALPVGQNSPQKVPFGLYAEKFSGSAFTAPKASNGRTWFYRIRPSVAQLGFSPTQQSLLFTAPQGGTWAPPDPLRWDPMAYPEGDDYDFVDGIKTMAVLGDARVQIGAGIHIYHAATSMESRYFYNSDGELLLVPQEGELRLHTECGVLDVAPNSIAVIPRGIKFRVVLRSGRARGYICENYGARLDLPERGLIGTDGLANARDFECPVACYEEAEGEFELTCKLDGKLYSAIVKRSPLDVVAWHGNLAPYRYDLSRFSVIGSTSYDHPDPSIFTVLTSQSDTSGVANLDFVIFAPRWLVMMDTFRPPWYHRNVMAEFMGLVSGQYDAKTGGGFVPGGSSLHNRMVPHGPDADAFQRASEMELSPQYLDNTMAFMFESRHLMRPTEYALSAVELQTDYIDHWRGLRAYFSDSNEDR